MKNINLLMKYEEDDERLKNYDAYLKKWYFTNNSLITDTFASMSHSIVIK